MTTISAAPAVPGDKEILLKLIELYGEMPQLYDKSHKNYSNKSLRDEGFKALLEIYKNCDKNATIKTLKKKIDNLKTTYFRELKKVKASRQTEAGTENVYVPTLWYFEAFNFLRSQAEPCHQPDTQVPRRGAATMALDDRFSLCWNNFHANMSAGFHGLLSRGDLVDVTLAAEGRLLQAHKLVLSVCSPYFQEMFKMNPTQHPIVILKDVSHSALRDLLQFMYQGEVNVKQEELASFISTAEQLQVKGLTGNQKDESSTPFKSKLTSRPGPRSSQQRQYVMTKLETDLDSKPSSTPVAIKRPKRPSIASNNSSSSQSGPAKRKCVDPLEAGPSGSAKEEFITIPDEDENNAVALKMEPDFVNDSIWDDDEEDANNDDTNFGEDDSNMEMTGFDGSATGDGNLTGSGKGGAVGDAQGMKKIPGKQWTLSRKLKNVPA